MMTKNKWRRLLITSLVTLAPILYGSSVYDRLPARMVTHWGMNNQPNGWMARPMVVFGLPLLMLVFHLITTLWTYYADAKGQSSPRLTAITAWIFPVITIVVYTTTIRYGLGAHVNTRLWMMAIVGTILIVLGNYLPTVPPERAARGRFWARQQRENPDGARKLLRILGYLYVASGVLMLFSLLLPEIVTVILLAAFIIANVIMVPLSYWVAR